MKRLQVLIIVLFLLIGGIFLWWHVGKQPVNTQNSTQQFFVVPSGMGLRDIANKLKSEGLIRDPIVFFLEVKRLGLDGKIQAGDFRLNPSMSIDQIAENLTHGTLDIWVTIPEGKRAEEVAEILQAKMPGFDNTWLPTLKEREGHLFPDTYLFPRQANAQNIASIMTANFDKQFSSLDGKIPGGLTKEQVITLASIIEREVRYASDRPIVASILYNRLALGMALQVDASVQYALGYQPVEKSWWKKDLTLSDLQIQSPYNTYKNVGLPPTPIANPGASALSGALHPASTNYLYYISDSTGHLHYAATLDEHNANIRKYGL